MKNFPPAARLVIFLKFLGLLLNSSDQQFACLIPLVILVSPDLTPRTEQQQ